MNLPRTTGYYLEPGYIYFSKRAAEVRTVLGSCVAVCIWDKELHYGGMNHFLWPRTEDSSKATPQYGNVATMALVRIMLDAGCQPGDLVAQILGGGAPEGVGGDHVGVQNARVAREALKRKGIEVICEDTGGHVGRKIVFDTSTGALAVLKVQSLRESDWHS